MEKTEFVTCFTEVCSAISYNHLLYYYYYFNWFVQNKKKKKQKVGLIIIWLFIFSPHM